MVEVDVETHEELYWNTDKSVEFCKNIENTKITEQVPFHAFWRVPKEFGRKQILPIKAYLTSQDLEHTNFTLWSNTDLTTNPLLKDVLPYINFKIYNPTNEAKGSSLEGASHLLNVSDSLCYADRDLFRLLILYKYGGIYIDMDTLLLRDLSPLLEQEFMYTWGSLIRVMAGGVMRFFQGSKLGEDCLTELGKSWPRTEEISWGSKVWTKVREYNKDWYVFPCAWFNTEWAFSGADYEGKDQAEWRNFVTYPFKKTIYSDYLYDGVFSWHWHNQWDALIEEGSKWYKFEQIINQKFDRFLEEHN